MDDSQCASRFALVTGDNVAEQHGSGIIYTGGTCAVVTQGGDSLTLPAAFAGIVLPIMIKQVLAAGTSATAIGLFR